MKWYTRWKHRRMIRRAWPLWYMEPRTLGRAMWVWRMECKKNSVKFSSVSEAMKNFDGFVRWMGWSSWPQGKAS